MMPKGEGGLPRKAKRMARMGAMVGMMIPIRNQVRVRKNRCLSGWGVMVLVSIKVCCSIKRKKAIGQKSQVKSSYLAYTLILKPEISKNVSKKSSIAA